MAFLMERLRPPAAWGVCVPALRTGLLAGAAAAATGLAAVALPVFFLWIVSPYVESGPGGVVHLAACLWLAAHGGTLMHGGTPLDVPPLLLSVLLLAGLYRAAARAGRAAEPDQAGSVLLGLCAGYLLVGACTVAAAATGKLDVVPASGFGCLALTALPVAVLGARRAETEAGRGRVALPPWLRLPGWLYVPGGAATALRAGTAAAAALLGSGALVLAASLLAHFGAAGELFAQLAPDFVGRLALLVLCAALLPNAAVWGAAYALGPGFTLVGGMGPLSAAAVRAPAFPLLAALPGPGRSLLGLSALALPPVAGAVSAVLVGRAARDWGPPETVRVGTAAALCTAVLATLCAAVSGGALGTAALAQVGPSPWWTGLAALGWTSAVGIPGALLVRWNPRLSRSASPASSAAAGSRWWHRFGRRPA
jgi:hypothetical protein